jgi:hypothetical protein
VTRPADSSGAAVDTAALLAVKLAVGACVLHLGFSHVSDDDYARTFIAQRFVVAPGLDPSGTSWLPLPFWIDGLAMAIAGRSLAVTRAVALTLSTLSVAAPYLAMRAALVPRAAAIVATAVAMVLPWNAWLGAATVPEAWTGAVVAAAVIALPNERALPWCAAGLLATSLSRYEAWPVAITFVGACLWRAARATTTSAGRPRRDVALALLAALGPLAWMAWNAHAHGSAFHFVARVARFRHAIGAADVPFADKLLGYPRALVVETPEAALLGLLGVGGLAASKGLRARWGWAAVASALLLVFLVMGDIRDSAPAVTPRALCLPSGGSSRGSASTR